MYRKELVRDWGSFHLPYCGWFLDCPLNCILISARLEQEKFDPGFLESLHLLNETRRRILIRRRRRRRRRRMLMFQAFHGPRKL
jgi:hypothetical protein